MYKLVIFQLNSFTLMYENVLNFTIGKYKLASNRLSAQRSIKDIVRKL